MHNTDDWTAPADATPPDPAAMKASAPLWNVLLFGATLPTTTWADAMHLGIDLRATPERWSAGLPYAVALLAILRAIVLPWPT